MTHAHVWEDDSLIHQLVVTKRGVRKPGVIVVTISEWHGEEE